jgi:hypothetical protein
MTIRLLPLIALVLLRRYPCPRNRFSSEGAVPRRALPYGGDRADRAEAEANTALKANPDDDVAPNARSIARMRLVDTT